MHRKLLVAGLAVAALVLAGCSSSDDTATDTTSAEATTEAAEEVTEEAAEEATEEAAAVTMDDSNCAAPENYCVGLVTDLGKVDDKSFNQAAFEGATLAAGELGAFLKYVESTDPKDYAANIGQFVDREYDTIVTVGFLMAEASALAATENPNINFVGVDQFQGETLPNLTGLIFAEDQA
ncbi:MAG: BMP family ABC transporter substrate-binding protein, partial [Candidatus Nanopelagicales bacterium]